MRVGQKLKLIDMDASVSFAKKEEHSGMKYSSAYVPPELLYVTPNKVSVRCPAVRTHVGVNSTRGGERDDMSGSRVQTLGQDSSIFESGGGVLGSGEGGWGWERGEREGWERGMTIDYDENEEKEEKNTEYSEIYGGEKRDRSVRNLVESYDSFTRRQHVPPVELVRTQRDSVCSTNSEFQSQFRNQVHGPVQGPGVCTDVQGIVRDGVWHEDGMRDIGRFSPQRYLIL